MTITSATLLCIACAFGGYAFCWAETRARQRERQRQTARWSNEVPVRQAVVRYIEGDRA